jgi:hypothetical protein
VRRDNAPVNLMMCGFAEKTIYMTELLQYPFMHLAIIYLGCLLLLFFVRPRLWKTSNRKWIWISATVFFAINFCGMAGMNYLEIRYEQEANS